MKTPPSPEDQRDVSNLIYRVTLPTLSCGSPANKVVGVTKAPWERRGAMLKLSVLIVMAGLVPNPEVVRIPGLSFGGPHADSYLARSAPLCGPHRL